MCVVRETTGGGGVLDWGKIFSIPCLIKKSQFAILKKKRYIEVMQPTYQPLSQLAAQQETPHQRFLRESATDPAFQAWSKDFTQRYGGPPNLDQGGKYNYALAWRDGMRPQPYVNPATGLNEGYHWGSNSPITGEMVKSHDHKTFWKAQFMNDYGVDPDSLGWSQEQGQGWLENRRKTTPDDK
jgi:hypothetical protein